MSGNFRRWKAWCTNTIVIVCLWLVMIDDGDWYHLWGEEYTSCILLELWLMMIACLHMWLGKFDDDENTLPMIGYDWWWWLVQPVGGRTFFLYFARTVIDDDWWLMQMMIACIHMWLRKFDDETTLPVIGYNWWWFACTWLMMMGTPCQWLIMNDDGDWFHLLEEEHPSCSSREGKTRSTQLFLQYRGILSIPRCPQNWIPWLIVFRIL